MGGLVTTHGAGMSVPDWPNSYGYNMFLFPPSRWIGGIWYEHVHRLAGTGVGFLAILMVLSAYGTGSTARKRKLALVLALAMGIATAVLGFIGSRREWGWMVHLAVASGCAALILAAASAFREAEPRRWVRRLTLGVLAAVIFQGVLGGLRVVWVELDLAIVHATFAQAFLCLVGLVAVVTSCWWATGGRTERHVSIGARPLPVALLWATVGLIFVQLIAGATMRHYRAGLAIPDLPLAFGRVLPPITSEQVAEANKALAWTWHLPPATVGQMWLHFSHRLGAVLVFGLLTVGIILLARRARGLRVLPWLAWVLAVLLIAQFTLGVLTVLWQKPADIASLHVAVGALLLLTVFCAAVMTSRFRFLNPVLRPVTALEETPQSLLAAAG
jgi:cytochrome c oxidase assembly protein subunit 15